MMLRMGQDALCILPHMANQDIQQTNQARTDTRSTQLLSRGYAPVFIPYILIP